MTKVCIQVQLNFIVLVSLWLLFGLGIFAKISEISPVFGIIVQSHYYVHFPQIFFEQHKAKIFLTLLNKLLSVQTVSMAVLLSRVGLSLPSSYSSAEKCYVQTGLCDNLAMIT